MARIEVLPTQCVGHGRCVKIAPEIFQLRFGCVEVRQPVIGRDDPELLKRARKAVYACPSKALLIDEG